jgi:hypothetical protein
MTLVGKQFGSRILLREVGIWTLRGTSVFEKSSTRWPDGKIHSFHDTPKIDRADEKPWRFAST